MTTTIDKDLLDGLPSAGSNIGGFAKNVAPGVGSLYLTTSIAGAVGSLPKNLVKGKVGKVHSHPKLTIKRHKIKSHHSKLHGF